MTEADKIAAEWIDGWNTQDLDRILALFNDECVMTSPKIQAYGHGDAGEVHGKEQLRAYWSDALNRAPDLEFTLHETFAGPRCVAINYMDQHGRKVCEFLRWNGSGLVVQAVAMHSSAHA